LSEGEFKKRIASKTERHYVEYTDDKGGYVEYSVPYVVVEDIKSMIEEARKEFPVERMSHEEWLKKYEKGELDCYDPIKMQKAINKIAEWFVRWFGVED